MKVTLNRTDWRDFKRGQERCFLLTNGLGGYTSLTVIGDNARGDHALFMAAQKAPNVRINLLANVREVLTIEGEETELYSQEFVNRTKNAEGYRCLEGFSMEVLPVWYYRVQGAEVEKTMLTLQGENTIAIRYRVRGGKAGDSLQVTPLMKFAPKGKNPASEQIFTADAATIESEGIRVYYTTNGVYEQVPEERAEDLYYDQDARDGRDAVGTVVWNHKICFPLDSGEQTFYLVYSLDHSVDEYNEKDIALWIEEENARRKRLMEQSGIRREAGQVLAASAFQYIVERESTGGKSILAGFPYFEDWGRDTMIALPGCTLATGDLESCRSILRTFMAYCHEGLMPNLFPEGDREPMYNTVDAALLFMEGVYEYYLESGDLAFVQEAYPVMEEIVFWYCKGADYHIRMEKDGLISAGDGLEQVTWMDVRIGDELPTPRHGKPVEINAYWYNGLKIMEEFTGLLPEHMQKTCRQKASAYAALAALVKESFLEQFWMKEEGYLKDVVNGTTEEKQFRCNQVFALALPYRMLSKEQGSRVLEAVKTQLYTPVGLRSLSPEDPAFHPWYGGSQPSRDRAYHQGTVWTFPLGAYYRAVLYYAKDSMAGKLEVERGLDLLESWLYEGCLFHLAEIYDGAAPVISKGCYAQAWSVGELLRVYKEVEKIEGH